MPTNLRSNAVRVMVAVVVIVNYLINEQVVIVILSFV